MNRGDRRRFSTEKIIRDAESAPVCKSIRVESMNGGPSSPPRFESLRRPIPIGKKFLFKSRLGDIRCLPDKNGVKWTDIDATGVFFIPFHAIHRSANDREIPTFTFPFSLLSYFILFLLWASVRMNWLNSFYLLMGWFDQFIKSSLYWITLGHLSDTIGGLCDSTKKYFW